MQILKTMKIHDNLRLYDICSTYQEGNILVVKKYIDGNNFGVIQNIHGICEDVGAVALNGIVKVKIYQDIKMGDVLAEYKHKQLVKKYKKVVYIKRLIALEDGISGDIIQAQIIY